MLQHYLSRAKCVGPLGSGKGGYGPTCNFGITLVLHQCDYAKLSFCERFTGIQRKYDANDGITIFNGTPLYARQCMLDSVSVIMWKH